MRQPTGWLPAFQIVRDLLTPKECHDLIQTANTCAYPALRIGDDGTTYTDREFRRCHTSHIKPGMSAYVPVSDRIIERLGEINQSYGFEFFPERERMVPMINVNRYDAAEFGGIGEHTDVGGFEDTENCKLAITIVLNKGFSGGDLNLYTGYRYKPTEKLRLGDAVVFPTFYVHSVDPVTQGTRYSGVVWLRGPRFR